MLVRVKGLEPPLPYGKQILSLPRLPFRHTRTRPECACSTGPRQGAQPPRRLSLGTAVIVLPWHDPVRVAEEIALLDILCGGRCVFGFGRGAASVEYEGFRIPMDEARPRFVEAAQIIVKALSNDSFEHEG